MMSNEDPTGEDQTIPTGRCTWSHSTPNRTRAISTCRPILKVYKMIKNIHGANDSKLDPGLSGIIDLVLFDDAEVEVETPEERFLAAILKRFPRPDTLIEDQDF